MKPAAEGKTEVKHRTLYSAKTSAIFLICAFEGRSVLTWGVEWR